VGVSATSLAAALPQQAASGAVPAALLIDTAKAVRALAAGEAVAAGLVSPEAAPLAEGMLHALAVAKQKAAGVGLALAALVLAGGMVAYHALTGPLSPRASRSDERTEVDVQKFGTAEDAIKFAIDQKDLDDRLRRLPGPNQIRLALDIRKGTKARLDPQSGQWIVTCFFRYPVKDVWWWRRPPVSFSGITQVDWQAVVRYNSSSRTWSLVRRSGSLGDSFRFLQKPDRSVRMPDFSFIKPKPGGPPVTCFHVVSNAGSGNGLGQPRVYGRKDLTVLWKDNQLTVRVGRPGAGRWTLKIQCPAAKPAEFDCPSPAATIVGLRAWQGEDIVLGKCALREVVLEDQRVVRLALDFALVSRYEKAPLCGSLRIHSSLRPAVPVRR
jgi:hypothetical protein